MGPCIILFKNKDYKNLLFKLRFTLVYRVIEEYNMSRYQWGLKKMAPVQYRDHLLAV
ncbi:IS3 family transposase [Peribacillus simplex]